MALTVFAQGEQLKVMTFNIRYDNPADGLNSWENRKGLVIGTLDDYSPDIIGMQEVLEHQLLFLKQNLPGYVAVGIGRDDGKSRGEYAPVFYRRDRFKMLNWGTFWLSETPNDTGSVGWDAALPRICTWAWMEDLGANHQLFVLNTHFDHMGQQARIESARLIMDYIHSRTLGLPVILTGDFNCTPSEEPYAILTGPDGALQDACQAQTDRDGDTFNGFGSSPEKERIDLIFFRGNYQVDSYSMPEIRDGEKFISDHYPVVVNLNTQNTKSNPQNTKLKTQNSELRTSFVQTFTFDSIFTRRAVFQFPEKSDKKYEKVLMYYTLKCDSLTPLDNYPCGEWDYTTYTRIYHHTGRMDSARHTQPSFSVRGQSPREYYYSATPTYSYYEIEVEKGEKEKRRHGDNGKKGQGNKETWGHGEVDQYLRFEGADHIEVPGAVFDDIDSQITVSFWLNGDVFSQPMAGTIFEGLDAAGRRVINLHVPYDNGVVYWDAGGYGEGLTDHIYKAAAPVDYKGRWNFWVVTKNASTGEQRIYLNGGLFQKGKDLRRNMEGITTFRIGSNGKGDGKFYRGSIDDIAVWNTELDSATIGKLYHSNPLGAAQDHLKLYFDFNNAHDNLFITDNSGNKNDGKTFGTPSLIEFGSMPYPDSKPQKEIIVYTKILNPLVSIVIYGDTLNPQKATDTITAWPGWNFYFNVQGVKIDSALVSQVDTLLRKTRIYYGKPFEIVEQFEIGRFITPYGKRLDLGENGFTWVYDVTDYEPLLHGPVDLQAANGQELLDLKFIFIEGKPAREVLSVKNIWPEGSYGYKELADNDKLQAASFKLQAGASSFMLRARISGHGHYGPYNCCEWVPKRHSWLINGVKEYEWTVWRDCGMNPVYPQGGTWQFDRAGWCPGTFVDTYDFEMTPLVRPGEQVSIDYSIEPYDLDNGEEGGNYEMAMHFFEYSKPNYQIDLELNDILAPSDRHEFRRMNPLSLNPVIRVKNLGSDTVRSFIVHYGLSADQASSFEWKGKLAFMQTADIILPKPSWKGLTGNSVFFAGIASVNGMKDERSSNDRYESVATYPVILPEEFIIHVKTQGFGRAADNSYKIINEMGVTVYERQVFEDDSTYHDRITLGPGAYDFTFSDKNEDGMIRHWWLYWEDPEKVGTNGELKLLDKQGNEIINLGHDWAEKRTLQFFVGGTF